MYSTHNEGLLYYYYYFIIIIIYLFSVDQINRIHNHSIYVKTTAIIEDKCQLKSTSLRK